MTQHDKQEHRGAEKTSQDSHISMPAQSQGSPAAHEMSGARALSTLFCGVLFGLGLSVSGMIHPSVILAFLTFSDMGLMLVMGGAAGVVMVVYRAAPRMLRRPLFGDRFDVHSSQWSRDTAVGAALFGVGWGLSGVCPGPALASIGTGNTDILWALLGIAAGALAQGLRAK